jgi:hypothetical protein
VGGRYLKSVWLVFLALVVIPSLARGEDYTEEKEIRPGVSSGYVGGNVTAIASDGYSPGAYFLDAVLNYETYRFKNGAYFEYANGEPSGTGNTQKVFFLDRTEFIGSGRKATPFVDFYYYQNPDEGYKSRVAAGPGIGINTIWSNRIHSRENIFVYLDQDQMTPVMSTVFTRALLGTNESFKFTIKRWLALNGNLVFMMATDNVTDYNVNFDTELSAIINKSFTLQLRWDEKYRHLLPRAASYVPSSSIELLFLYTF